MKHETNERVKEVMQDLGLSINAFALDYLGLKNSESMRQYLDDKRPISSKVLQIILEKVPKLNPTWLHTGKGIKYLGDEKDWTDPSQLKWLYLVKYKLEQGEVIDYTELCTAYLKLFSEYQDAIVLLSARSPRKST